MALFNKTKFEDVNFDSSANVAQPNQTSNVNSNAQAAQQRQPVAPNTNTAQPQATRPSPVASGYGIQEAIELIRKLPNVNTDIVINVVIKTLESANISVDKIIKDAQGRESKIEDRSGRLISKIEALEAEISELNEEITLMNTELEETNRVKELLLRSLTNEAPEPSRKPAVTPKVAEEALASADET